MEGPEAFGSRLDRDEAMIAAEAEKPVRDLAREEGVDEATKAVFDARAEQRGEAALGQHREHQESLKGLINPELQECDERIKEIRGLIQEEFGEDLDGHLMAPWLLSYHIDPTTNELTSIQINGLAGEKKGELYGFGALGKKLESAVIAWYKQGARKDTNKPDQFLLDAYKYDPEAKVLIDRFIDLNKEIKNQNDRKNEISMEKKKSYEKAENINAFLEKIGITKQVPSDLNFSKLQEEIKEAQKTNDHEKVQNVVRQLAWAFSIFDGLKITKKQKEDFGVDLQLIEEWLRDSVNKVRYPSNYSYPEDKSKEALAILESSETGKKCLRYKEPMLYEVEG